jgi:nucleoid DNA-binding protein
VGRSNVTKKAAGAVLKALIETIHGAIKEEGPLRIDGHGTFKVTERKARTGVNPRTGAKMAIPASKVPTFRASKSLKDVVRGPEKKVEKQSEKKPEKK